MAIKVIAFDADDTLWVNEPYFRDTENKFCSLLEDYLPQHTILQELFKTEMDNLALYGYGIKGFMLCMIETALRITNNKLDNAILNRIIDLGKEMLEKPIELLDGVEDVLQQLKGHYRLVVATKGDLLEGITSNGVMATTETLLIRGKSRTIRRIKSIHFLDRKDSVVRDIIL